MKQYGGDIGTIFCLCVQNAVLISQPAYPREYQRKIAENARLFAENSFMLQTNGDTYSCIVDVKELVNFSLLFRANFKALFPLDNPNLLTGGFIGDLYRAIDNCHLMTSFDDLYSNQISGVVKDIGINGLFKGIETFKNMFIGLFRPKITAKWKYRKVVDEVIESLKKCGFTPRRVDSLTNRIIFS